ncbi:MAG: tRNA (adenine(22)-N(1))-methyltransferase TrmK [Lachnotalea sp.]
MQLSKRLTAVADMVSNGNRLVDVGTDHGYIPIFLVENGQVPSAIALDINKGPIQRAKEHILEHNLEKYIETRLSDGVTALNANEGDTLVIAGMGGGLIIKIITQGEEILSNFIEFVLQPQSEIEQVRKFIIEKGYNIVEENMILDEGKYYPMMKVTKNYKSTSEYRENNINNRKSNDESLLYQERNASSYNNIIFYKYGKNLLKNKNATLKLFLEKELNTYTGISEKLSANAQENARIRIKEIKDEINYIKEALLFYEM